MKPKIDITLDELIRLAEAGSDRVTRIDTGERVVWIKRAGAKTWHPGHYLQKLLSLGLPGTIYRPSPLEIGPAATRGEAMRLRDFATKGMQVPEIIYQGKDVLILSDCGPTVNDQLGEAKRAGDIKKNDELLLVFGKGIAELSAAGLVHGRPHPRDCFIRNGKLGFLDLEQNPAAGMTLDRAQARDALFAFGYICEHAKLPDTADCCFDAWEAKAPAATRLRLTTVLRQTKPLYVMAKAAARIFAGADLRRFLGGTGFLMRRLGVLSQQAPALASTETKDRA